MNIYINRDKQYQTFENFGASGAWWAQVVGGWEHIDAESGRAVRDRIAQLLYSKTDGIGLGVYRYNIGGGSAHSGKGKFKDETRRAESFDDGYGCYDFSRDANAVYMMKQAVKEGADEVTLFVNSPVERLTKNGKAHCDKIRSFRDNLSPDNYKAFAKYCLDVTEHFVEEGLPVKYLSPVNEPLWAWNGGQEGCFYKPSSVAEVMRCFAEEIESRGKLNGVKLAGAEAGDIRWFNKTYTREMLKYDNVLRNIDSLDLHSYFLRAPLPFMNNRVAFLKRFRKWMNENYPDIPIKMSEWTHMKKHRDKSVKSALVMAKVMWEDISILNVVSWQHWIAVSSVDFCDGLIYINLNDKTFEMTKRYYATGNFSKYIPYKAVRVEARADDKDLRILAFVKDEKTVLIVINDSKKEKSVSLSDCPDRVTLVVTNDTDNLKEYRDVGSNIKISPGSVNTVIFEVHRDGI